MKKVVSFFLIWRLYLFALLFVSLFTIPLGENFLGGGYSNYLRNPFLWAWLNFDGEHYLAIAQRGYRDLEYFFFPMYPMLIRAVSSFLPGNFTDLAYVGLVISNMCFLFSLIGLYKLVMIDYEERIAFLTILLLIVFPGSFFFASFYTESLFFALAVWAFYFALRGKWFWAFVLCGLSSATRIVGIALLLGLVTEYFENRNRRNLLPILILIGISGLIAYMLFLYLRTQDPLAFFHNIGIYGAQRSQRLILFPQVFYRYFFKIIPNLNYHFFPSVFSTFLELSSAVIVLVGLVGGVIKKIRLSYLVYLLSGFLISTVPGSFSSLPRYILVLFPIFVIFSLYLSGVKKYKLVAVLLLLVIVNFIAAVYFFRGYWVA